MPEAASEIHKLIKRKKILNTSAFFLYTHTYINDVEINAGSSVGDSQIDKEEEDQHSGTSTPDSGRPKSATFEWRRWLAEGQVFHSQFKKEAPRPTGDGWRVVDEFPIPMLIPPLSCFRNRSLVTRPNVSSVEVQCHPYFQDFVHEVIG